MPLWIGYIGVDDVDATVEAITARGGPVFIPPNDIPGVGRFAMVADPQGAPFYVMRGASDDASTVWQDNAVGHWGWNELWTPDQPAALDFYGSLFGWRQDGAMPMGPRGDYLFIMQGDKRLGAIGPASDPAKPAYWRQCVPRAFHRSGTGSRQGGRRHRDRRAACRPRRRFRPVRQGSAGRGVRPGRQGVKS